MKKLCFITTVSTTVRSFLLPVLSYYAQHTDWELTVVCDYDPLLQEQLPDGVKYYPISMKRGISLGGIAACWKMCRFFRKEKFDLVQYSTPNAAFYASIASALAGIPVRLYCQWGMVFVGMQGIKRLIFKTIERLVCLLSTWIEPDSHGNLEFCRQQKLYSPAKSSVIWNGSAAGVNLEKFDIAQKSDWRQKIRTEYNIDEKAFVYGFVGRINGDKGINELFTAFQQILRKHPQRYLMLVGNPEISGSVDPALYNWAQQSSQVLFCGYTDEVEQYLSAMDVYILPSYREGFGSGVIEAEAMGVPVIVTDIPGPTNAMLPNVTGLVVPKQDISALYESMMHLPAQTDLCKALGEAGFRFATEKFEQQALCHHILCDRKRLLGER